MRHAGGGLAALLLATALAPAAPPALALPGESGGTAVPSVASSAVPAGGPAHPVVSRLSVPAGARPGSPPRVTLEVQEPGVRTVDVVVSVNNLVTRRPALTVALGWVATGRLIVVRWPRGAALGAGSYHVSVSAHDRRGSSLLRTAHSSGVATLTIAAPTPAAAPAPAPIAEPAEAGVPTPAQTAAAAAVFPVAGAHNFGGPENIFGAPRDGYSHQGQDILTAEGTPVLAPLTGSILTTSYQAAGAGYYAVERTDIGFDFMFAHCQAGTVAVSTGQAVSPGEQLCRAGQTGDATAPHLDFEMWVGGWQAASGHPINPLPYLEAWEHDGA